MKLILNSFLLIFMFSCVHLRPERSLDAIEQVNIGSLSKNDINDYAYLETTTGIYNSSKAAQDQLSKKETELAVEKLNAAKEIGYNESNEEKIEKLATKYISENKWKLALDTLVKYEPILTHNKNLTNQLIFVSLKLDYYDLAIDQLKVALKYEDENRNHLDKEIILAHAYYLSDKFLEATALYTELLKSESYPDAKKYLFLIGYKQKNLTMMYDYLKTIDESSSTFLEYSVLTAKLEIEKEQYATAYKRLSDLYNEHPDNQELALEYVNVLIKTEKYKDAIRVLDNKESSLAELRQYHFIKAYIYYQSGDKLKFQEHLIQVHIEDQYKKYLTKLFLNKEEYQLIYAKIFGQGELEQYKFTQLVKMSVEEFTSKYINRPQFKDSALVREEFHPVTEPIRLPASLEFKPSR